MFCLCLVEFPESEFVHIIAPIGATFLRYRAAQMKASSKRPRVELSGVTPPLLLLLLLQLMLQLRSPLMMLLLMFLHLLLRIIQTFDVCWRLS